jgi:hypothetical protein
MQKTFNIILKFWRNKMKKQLLIAAVAATLGTSAMADISITGDALMRYASTEDANGSAADENQLDQRIRLKMVGTSGDTKVVMGLRTDNDEATTTARTGGADATMNGIETDYRFISTKVGGATVKVGEWWESTGLGLVRKGQSSGTNAVRVSGTVADVDLGLQGTVDGPEVVIDASTTIAGVKLGLEHDTTDNTGYIDATIEGKMADINYAAEIYQSDATASDADAHLVHLFTKIGGATVHFAAAKWEADSGTARVNNVKFSPLGVSILGTATGINGELAVGNVNAGTTEDKVTGARVDFNMAGNSIQLAAGNLEVGTVDKSFTDIIVTRDLAGAKLALSAGEWNSRKSMGAKISVKF